MGAKSKGRQRLELKLKFPAAPKSAAAARRSVANGLGEFVDERHRGDLELVVSELVTNSIRHAGLDEESFIEVEVTATDNVVHLEVADPGPGFSPNDLAPVSPDRIGGWGLYLVGRIANRWGVRSDDATRVWVEIDLHPDSELSIS